MRDIDRSQRVVMHPTTIAHQSFVDPANFDTIRTRV